MDLEAVRRDRTPKYDPLVLAYIANEDAHYVSKRLVPRTAAVIQSILDEARLRGYDVLSPRQAAHLASFIALKRTTLYLTKGHGSYRFRLLEISGPGGARNDYDKSKPAWKRDKVREFIPTGRLEIRIECADAMTRSLAYRDAKALRVEQKLPALFDALAIFQSDSVREAAARDERHRVEEEEAARVREESLRVFNLAARRTGFEEASDRWRRARRMREFASALDGAIARMEPGMSQSAAAEWSALGREFADHLDPLTGTLSEPPIEPPSEFQLDRFMRGLN